MVMSGAFKYRIISEFVDSIPKEGSAREAIGAKMSGE